ncbi:Lsr2 family protein [Allobranchiibius sp. GilTou73]|uniref:histone-like nucleoid-structuring protein Lsr2 n=1 Tax=Allobranchiibius sp. GilTou73 TaxID=2904523 RepID=UPI001F1968A9|nr:Lsr2 family protein [Allobranchiibius sp. GilTou73]UIJ35709.1 Lsr2 family protein [Allobranchiibius sp. GilTou73]
MTQRVVTVLEDDLDGGPAVETVRFALDGVTYEIDVSKAHAEQLRSTLGTWREHARRAGTTHPAVPRQVETPVDPRAVRAWATSRDLALPSKGRIPDAVVEQFRAAGN